MGSIQALRSEALALRAQEDTNMQISGYLGGVNKSLGNQITQLLDQLQATIKERTKAYNQLMSKVNKSILGKDGIGDKAIRSAFALANAVVGLISAIRGDTYSLTTLVTTVIPFITTFLDIAATDHLMKAAVYDYQKAASQLGNIGDMSSTPGLPNSPRTIGGAAELLEKRDAIMPRFKPNDTTYLVGNALQGNAPSTWNGHDHRGYVGTLRRV